MARSAGRRAQKTSRWFDSGKCEAALQKIQKSSTVHSVEQAADHFWVRQSSAAAFSEKFASEFGSVDLGGLESLPAAGQILFPVPDGVDIAHGHPAYYAARFDKVLTAKVQRMMIACWDRLLAAGVMFPKPDPNRSGSPALHLGIWELYMSLPQVSLDTVQQNSEVVTIMDELFGLLARYVVPKMNNLMRRYYPAQYRMCQRAYERVKRVLAKQFAERPALDFSGAFFNVAIKEGGSERLHLDFNDHKLVPSWVLAVGEWSGGMLSLPQLGVNVPILGGQLLSAMTGTLAHSTRPIDGRRIVFTFFSDKFLLDHTNEAAPRKRRRHKKF